MNEYIAKFSVKPGKRKTDYIFICAACDKKISVRVRKSCPEKELMRAWHKAGKYFTRCPECGAWVCRRCYSASENCCIECSDKQFEKLFKNKRS